MIAAIAVAVGVRAEIWAMFVPSRIVFVCEPHQASGEIASLPHDSAVKAESYPSDSTIRIVSGIPWGIERPQYPMCHPSFIPES